MKIAVALAQSMLDEVGAAIDSGVSAGQLNLYDENGVGVPSDIATAITTEILLAEIPLNDPSFAAAIASGVNATAALDVTPIPEDSSANANATASPTLFARMRNSTGTEYVQFDTVGVGSGELQLNSLNVVSGAAVELTAGTLTMPGSS